MSQQVFGMMDGTYFVGRSEILAWINGLLSTNYTKIEETASGAAACQILDAIWPGKIPLGKVNFAAKADWEFTNNYKVLQQAFKTNNVDKVVPVGQLVKAKYQDNLEWLQWLKRYFDINANGEDYDAVGRRLACKCNYPGDKGATAGAKKPVGTAKPATTDDTPVEKPTPAVSAAPARARAATTTSAAPKPRQTVVPPASRTTTTSAPKKEPVDRRVSLAADRVTPKPPVDSARRGSLIPRLASDERVTDLTKQIAELRLAIDNTEKERDFYYTKLLEIEEIVQRNRGDPAADLISKILVAGSEDDSTAADVVASESSATSAVSEPEPAVEEDAEEY